MGDCRARAPTATVLLLLWEVRDAPNASAPIAVLDKLFPASAFPANHPMAVVLDSVADVCVDMASVPMMVQFPGIVADTAARRPTTVLALELAPTPACSALQPNTVLSDPEYVSVRPFDIKLPLASQVNGPPIGPVDPVGPVEPGVGAPVEPVGPVAPVGPVNPVGPPPTPVGPVNPVNPVGPVVPVNP